MAEEAVVHMEALLVSGLAGVARREADIAQLETVGWERSSEPDPLYGSVWVVRRLKLEPERAR